MPQKSIKDMERELVEAKRAEIAHRKMLDEHTEKYAGKAFMFAHSHPTTKHRGGWKNCKLILFKSFELREHDDALTWSGDEVSVLTADQMTWSFCYKRVYRSTVYDSERNPHIEVSLDLFKAAVAYSKVAAASTMNFLRDIHDAKQLLDWQPTKRVPKDEEIGVELDLAYITLVNSEVTILGRTLFTTVDDKYLITPTSVQLGLELVKKEARELSRTADLWQECDMKYVRSRQTTLADLTAKLKRGSDAKT